MATIKTLSVSIVANVTKFSDGMKSAASTVNKFGGTVANVATKVASLGAVMTGAAVAGLTYYTKESFKVIDANAKMADALGVTTEFLSGLGHAANLAGSSQATVAKSLTRLGKSISEANSGIGTARISFQALGIDIKELANLGAEDQFFVLADAISGVGNVSDRTRIAADILGRSGVELINTMKDGAGPIRAMIQEAEALGISMDRNASAKVELANDSMTRLGGVLTGVGNAIAVNVAPYIMAAADALVDMAKSGGGMGAIVSNAFKSITLGIAEVASYLDLLQAGWYTFSGVINTVASTFVQYGIGGIIKGLDKLLEKVGLSQGGTAAFIQGIQDGLDKSAAEEFARANVAFDKFARGDRTQDVLNFFGGIEEKAKKLADEIAKANEKKKELANDSIFESTKNTFSNLANAAKRIFESTRTPLENLKSKVEELHQLRALQLIDEDTFVRAINKAKENFDSLTKTVNKTADSLKNIAKSAFESTRTPLEEFKARVSELQKAFEAGAFEGFGGKDTFMRAVEAAKRDFLGTAEAEGRRRNIGTGAEVSLSRISNQALSNAKTDTTPKDQLRIQGEILKVLQSIRDDGGLAGQALTV